MALCILMTGAPPEPWAAWVIVSLIGGRNAFLRLHPSFFERYISPRQLYLLESWVELLKSGKALILPTSELWGSSALRDFLVETGTQVRVDALSWTAA